MVIKQSDGCTAHGHITINSNNLHDLSDKEKQELWLVILNKLSDKYTEYNLQELICYCVETFGKYEYIGHCDQCGDSIGEYTVEL